MFPDNLSSMQLKIMIVNPVYIHTKCAANPQYIHIYHYMYALAIHNIKLLEERQANRFLTYPMPNIVLETQF